NPIADAQHRLQERIRELVAIEDLTEDQADELDRFKAALAIVSGLEAESPRELRKHLERLDRHLERGRLDLDEFEPPTGGIKVSGEEIYVNQKTLDLVTKAEMERLDYREERDQNVFFGIEKIYFGVPLSTPILNRGALALFTLASLFALFVAIQRKLNRVH
ncbi:MAG TPA: hypothetical protein VMN39_04805, partial [Longimicrobiaceae bacterium]|nr:hypothetical protein [Longimicrobiaceae bacterium]